MHSFLCFSKIGFLHDIDLYLGLLSLDNCDFDSKQLSLPVAISACRAAPMGANPLGHTFKPLTLYDISIYTIYFSHPRRQKDGFRVFFEAFFCRASFKRHTGKLTILTDCRQDRCTFGGAERSMIHHSGLSHRTAIPSYQVRVYTAFIQKNQLFYWYFFREFFPFRPLFLYIGAAPVPKRESPSSSASTPISRARSDPVGIH